MSEWRVAFADEAPESPIEWRVVSGDGAIESRGSGSLEEFSHVRAEKTALVLPGVAVNCFQAPLAARSERQARAAAGFAIEDDVATDIDTLHIALLDPGAEGQPGHRTIFALDSEVLSIWREAFDTLKIPLKLAYPDYMGLPVDTGVQAALLKNRAVLRAGQWGTAVEPVLGAEMLDAVLDAKAMGGPVHIAGVVEGAAPWQSRHINARACDHDALDIIARGAAHSPINLLQGEHAIHQSIELNRSRWITALSIPTAAAIAFVAADLFQGMSLNRSANELRAETAKAFQETFPEVGRVVNPRAQLRALSASGSAGEAEFLILSSFLAAAIQSSDDVTIDSVRFDASRREVDVSVLFSSYAALADFRAAIEAAGGTVEEKGSRQAGSQRSGELTVTRS